MLSRVAPKDDPRTEKEVPVIDPADSQAAQILAHVAQASAYRAERGKDFWGGYYRRRVERFRRMPLASCVSRLMDACHTSPAADSTQDLTKLLGSLSTDETKHIERALRDRPALLVALAYDQIRGPAWTEPSPS